MEEIPCYFMLNKIVQIATSALKWVKTEQQSAVQNQVQVA
jgi:hypothetical protein